MHGVHVYALHCADAAAITNITRPVASATPRGLLEMTVQLSRISCGGGALKQIELVKNTNSETAVRVLL